MKKHTIGSVLYSSFFSFFIIFIILLSYCVFPNFIFLNRFIRYLCLILSILIFVFYFFNFKYSKFIIILFVFVVMLIMSSLFGEYSSINEVFRIYFRIVFLSCYLDYGLKKYPKSIINSLYFSFYILTIINFYTIIKYPNGLYTTELYSSNWFFGYDNTHIFMYLPSLILLFCTKKVFKPQGILLFLIIAFCIFRCFSANSVVAFSIFLIYILFSKITCKVNILNIKSYFFTYIILFFTFVEFRIQNLFRWLIVDVLHKSLTLSTRTILWDRVENYVIKHSIIGYGQEPNDIIIAKYGDPHFTHAHNTFLDVVYKVGIIGLIFHLLLIILPCKELYKYKDYYITKIVSVILFISMIMMVFEARQEKIGLYLVLVLAYNIESIIISFGHNKKINLFKGVI